MARVLVIDDDEELRTLMKAMLVGTGHQVHEAVDGLEGLRMFEQHRSDVVVTDINMPGMDGHEVITTFRKRHPGVPIVAISGGGSVSKDDLLLSAARLGATEVIMKPFEFRQFVGAVERAVETRRSRGQDEAT
jgi:CheY-like chemotaxis protein